MWGSAKGWRASQGNQVEVVCELNRRAVFRWKDSPSSPSVFDISSSFIRAAMKIFRAWGLCSRIMLKPDKGWKYYLKLGRTQRAWQHSGCWVKSMWIVAVELELYKRNWSHGTLLNAVATWMGGESGGELMHIWIWLSPFAAHLKLPQHC